MVFTESVFHEGHINTLLGPPGSGKTNCALVLGEKAIDSGFFVYTNIHFFDISEVSEACNKGLLPKGVHYRRVPLELKTVKRLSDLLLGLLKTDKNIVILDESGIFASSTAPMAKRTREIKEFSYVIRHFRSSLLFITQSKTAISPALRSELVTYEMRMRKLSKYFRKLTVKRAMPVKNDEGNEDISFIQTGPVIKKVPLTRYPWDSFFIPKFDFDISLERAFSVLGEVNSVKLRRKDSNGITYGEKVIKELKEETDEEGKPKKGISKSQKLQKEVRDNFELMVERGKFEKRSDILAKLASDYAKSYGWAYQTCRGLKFKKSNAKKK